MTARERDCETSGGTAKYQQGVADFFPTAHERIGLGEGESSETVTSVRGGSGDAAFLRGAMLVLVIAGSIGLILELLLLEHTESVWQWVPLVLLVSTLVAGVAAWLRPGPRVFRYFQVVMGLCLIAGVLGILLHYKGNVEWELESDPAANGLGLVWRALHGATPTLAPAAMAQLAISGLLFTFRHPARKRPRS